MVTSQGNTLGVNDGAAMASISHQEIDQKISEWVVSGPRHACAVEEKTFQDLIQSLVPNYKVPSAMVVAGMINARYFTAKSNLQRNLLNAAEKSKVALSIRLITSPQNWLLLSAHFITNIWTLSTQILGCVRGDVISQTGEAVAKWINDKLQDLSLSPGSIAAIVHSNEAWITCGVNMLADAFGWHSLLCSESLLHFVTENLCQDPLVATSLCKVSTLIQFFTESEIGKNLLHHAKEQTEYKNVCDTAIYVPQELRPESSQINESNFDMVQILVKVLQPLDAALSYLKKNDFVPSSAVPILLSGLEKKILSEVEVTATIIKEECSSNHLPLGTAEVEKRLKRKFLDLLKNLTIFSSNDITAKAAALDPRYKKLFFISSDERQAVCSMISAECFFIHKDEPQEKEAENSHLLKVPRLEASRGTSSRSSIMDDIMKLGSGCHDEEEQQDTSQEILLNRIKKEMDVYFSEKPPPSDVDPLGWWKVNQSRFPMLAQLARFYLCIPATSRLAKFDLDLTASGICNHIPLCKGDPIVFSKS